MECWWFNQANLRELIAATGQVILLKLNSNNWFFSPYDLEIRWMTSKNSKAPLLCCFTLCKSFRSHQLIQTGVTVWKCPIPVKIGHFSASVTLKFDGWPRKNRSPLLCYFKLCASFRSHQSIRTGVTVHKSPIWVKMGKVLSRVTLKFDGWPWKNDRAHFLCYFKFCVSFHSHQSIRTGVAVRTRPLWVKITDLLSHVTLKFDSWPQKTNLSYVTSSFVLHFIAIYEFKMELRSRNG